MQYILDEKEMEAVRKLRSDQIHLPSSKILQEMCSKIADEWATWTGWDENSNPEPWGCVLTTDYEHYCDRCPVQDICPNPNKEWRK